MFTSPTNITFLNVRILKPNQEWEHPFHNISRISPATCDPNNKILLQYSTHGLNYRPFDDQTVLDDFNTKTSLVYRSSLFYINF